MAARCAFVLVGWSAPPELEATVGALPAVARAGERILFVDNGRRPETRAWIEGKGDPRLEYLDPGENRGFAGALNFGIGKLDLDALDWVVTMSDDALLDQRFRETLDEQLGEERTGVLGPVPRRLSDKSAYFVSRRLTMRCATSVAQEPPPGRFAETDYVEGRCLAVRASLLKKLGPFDERFFIWLEDVDFCLRASRAGFRVLVDTESSVYDAEKSGAPSRFKRYLNARNRMYLVLKHGTVMDAAFAMGWIGLVDAARRFAAPASEGGGSLRSAEDTTLAVFDGIRLRLKGPASTKDAAFARVKGG